MPNGRMPLEFVSTEFCRAHPDTYKLCTSAICVHIDIPCPCEHGAEFRCTDGQCIPNAAQCNGIRDCSRGEDELSCPGQVVTSPDDGLSLHVILGVVSVCLIVCAATIAVLGYFVLRRRKNNTSRESQSATQPLKTKYPSPVADSSEKFEEPEKPSSKRDYVYHQMYDASEDGEYEYDKQVSDENDKLVRDGNNKKARDGNDKQARDLNDKRVLDDRDVEQKKKEQEQQTNRVFVPTICVLKNMKVYNFDQDANESFEGCDMGKYIFKPRLKANRGMRKDTIEPQTSSVHEIVHSYKHAHKDHTSMPATFNIDLDPDDFCSTFATELLCSSTPRQQARRLAVHQSHDSLADDVIVINMMPDTSPKGTETKESPHKSNSALTNTVTIDRSLLNISTNIEYMDSGKSITDIPEDMEDEVF